MSVQTDNNKSKCMIKWIQRPWNINWKNGSPKATTIAVIVGTVIMIRKDADKHINIILCSLIWYEIKKKTAHCRTNHFLWKVLSTWLKISPKRDRKYIEYIYNYYLPSSPVISTDPRMHCKKLKVKLKIE